MNIVDAQRTRRVLDRIVGYKLTPLLWKNVRSGLSAGRVQSVAARIIVEREEEIRAFVPSEYWTLDAILKAENGVPFTAHYWGTDGVKVKLENGEQTNAVVNDITGKSFNVSSVRRGERHKQPAPPFTTSTLQQEASKKLGFQSAYTMKLAQELYEGVNLGTVLGGAHGLITYMRTDSQRISEDAQTEAKEYITGKYGEQYYPATPRVFKTKAGAQDAHEAIRPVSCEYEPSVIRKHLTNDQYKLYKLIWDRFIASQMQSAALSVLNIECVCGRHTFRAGGYTVTFPGFMVLYQESVEESRDRDDADDDKEIRLPDMKEGQILPCDSVDPERHFTEAPQRYSEASLIKFLEDKGIGRPSTYATIITTIIQRNYVARDGKVLVPTALGEVTTKLMKEYFESIIDYKFTADIETGLDDIENGTEQMDDMLSDFWKKFEKLLTAAEEELKDKEIEIPAEKTDIKCDNCGEYMIVKVGRFGKFAACPNYPTCKCTKPLTQKKAPIDDIQPDAGDKEKTENAEEKANGTGIFCEKCGAEMVLRTGRFGSFYACPNYPDCKTTKARTKETDVPCPKCGSKVLQRFGRNKTVFYSCEKYPECDFSSWDLPTGEKCPNCGGMLFRKKGKPMLVCGNKDCGFSKELPKNGNEEQ